MFRLAFTLRRLARRTWVRCALFCALAFATALVAVFVQPLIPDGVARGVGADAIEPILGVIASSMPAVATFSLSIMVSAYSSATTTATPRATSLLIQDATAQNAVATFVGAFIFAMVGIVLLSTGIYQAGGRLVLLFVTVLVIVAVVAVLIRWIDQLSRLGRVHETVDLIEAAATAALVADRARPRLGAGAGGEASPGSAEIFLDDIGYVQDVDMAALEEIGARLGATLHLFVRPGAFVYPGRAVAAAAASLEEGDAAAIRDAIVVGDDRTFETDPRFGLICLSEVASRALSPAVNDPGTAIDVVNTLIRVFAVWDRSEAEPEAETYAHVSAPALDAGEMLDDAFAPIARAGAGMAEVVIRLQKAFQALADARDPALAAHARRSAEDAWRRAERAVEDERDLRRIERAALAFGPSDAT